MNWKKSFSVFKVFIMVYEVSYKLSVEGIDSIPTSTDGIPSYVPTPIAGSTTEYTPLYVPSSIVELESSHMPKSMTELESSIAALEASIAALELKPAHCKRSQVVDESSEKCQERDYSERFWMAVRTIRARLRKGQLPNVQYFCDYFQVDFQSVRDIYADEAETPEKYSNMTPEEFHDKSVLRGGDNKRRKVDTVRETASEKSHDANEFQYDDDDDDMEQEEEDSDYVPASSTYAEMPVYEPTPISELKELAKDNFFDRTYSLRYWMAVEAIRERYVQKMYPNAKFYCEQFEVDYDSVRAIYAQLDETADKYGFRSPEEYHEQQLAQSGGDAI